MDKYSICMVIHEFYPVMAGAELFVFEISRRLVRRGHTIHIITRHHRGLPRYESLQGIHIHRIPFLDIHHFRSITFYLPAYLKLCQLIKRHSIDLVHGHIPRIGGFIASLIKKTTDIPCIVTVQGLYREDVRFAKFIIKFALKNASLIHSTSNDLKTRITQLDDSNEVIVIPNGVDTLNFNPNVDGHDIRQRYKLGITPTILTVSRLVPKNGIKYLLLAFVSAIKVLPNAKLLIIGEGTQRKELIKLANKLNIAESTLFLGFQEHSKIPKFLAACDLFVRPSLDEGFGIVFLEAMASQKPVIATEVGGIVDIITDGDTGILVSPGDPEELSKAIITLLTDETRAKKLAKKGLQTVKTRFAWSNVVKQLYKLYRNLINGSK